jgi:hypothetical protein
VRRRSGASSLSQSECEATSLQGRPESLLGKVEECHREAVGRHAVFLNGQLGGSALSASAAGVWSGQREPGAYRRVLAALQGLPSIQWSQAVMMSPRSADRWFRLQTGSSGRNVTAAPARRDCALLVLVAVHGFPMGARFLKLEIHGIHEYPCVEGVLAEAGSLGLRLDANPGFLTALSLHPARLPAVITSAAPACLASLSVK